MKLGEKRHHAKPSIFPFTSERCQSYLLLLYLFCYMTDFPPSLMRTGKEKKMCVDWKNIKHTVYNCVCLNRKNNKE